jgi:hypothetical protein
VVEPHVDQGEPWLPQEVKKKIKKKKKKLYEVFKAGEPRLQPSFSFLVLIFLLFPPSPPTPSFSPFIYLFLFLFLLFIFIFFSHHSLCIILFSLFLCLPLSTLFLSFVFFFLPFSSFQLLLSLSLLPLSPTVVQSISISQIKCSLSYLDDANVLSLSNI